MEGLKLQKGESGGREWREMERKRGRLLQNEWVPPTLGCSSMWEAEQSLFPLFFPFKNAAQF